MMKRQKSAESVAADQEAIVEAEKKAKEEADRKAKEEADKKAKEEADRKAKEEADRKAKDEADRKAKEEADKKAKEEADRKAKDEADRKAKEEADRKAKEEADKKAKEEAYALPTDLPISQARLSEYKIAFSLLDKDGDGTITAKEFATLLGSIGQSSDEAELQVCGYRCHTLFLITPGCDWGL